MLRGEPGIGKSRIVKSIVDVATLNNHKRVVLQCSPYHADTAFFPFVQQITHAAGITSNDAVEDRLNKVATYAKHDLKIASLLASLMGLDGTMRYEPLDGTPAELRTMTMQVLVDMFLADAMQIPLLMVVEDLHWVDPTSLELLDQIVAEAGHRKVLILATSRPVTAYAFSTPDMDTTLELSRLGQDEFHEMIARLTGDNSLPREIVKVIVKRTDGVPLFVEELTKTILESDALVEDAGRYHIKGLLGDIAIPATLHDSLMARLDRLGDTKEIAQIAACIGREFSYALMARICDLPEELLAIALDKLTTADLIQRAGEGSHAIYIFKHALVRDAAYNSLLKDVRRKYHQRILTATETDMDTTPEFLAIHAEAAHLTDRAIALWQAAGSAAMSRPAYQEAETHLRRAILLNTPKVMTSDRDAMHKAIALLVQLFVSLAPEKGLWSDDSLATLEEAMTLADKVGETPLRADIIFGL